MLVCSKFPYQVANECSSSASHKGLAALQFGNELTTGHGEAHTSCQQT